MRQVSCIEFVEKYSRKNIQPIIFLASIHIAAGIGRHALKRHHGGLIIIGDEKHVRKCAWELDANNPLKVHYGKKITFDLIREIVMMHGTEEGAILISSKGKLLSASNYLAAMVDRRKTPYGFEGCRRTIARFITMSTKSLAITISKTGEITVLREGKKIGKVMYNPHDNGESVLYVLEYANDLELENTTGASVANEDAASKPSPDLLRPDTRKALQTFTLPRPAKKLPQPRDHRQSCDFSRFVSAPQQPQQQLAGTPVPSGSEPPARNPRQPLNGKSRPLAPVYPLEKFDSSHRPPTPGNQNQWIDRRKKPKASRMKNCQSKQKQKQNKVARPRSTTDVPRKGQKNIPEIVKDCPLQPNTMHPELMRCKSPGFKYERGSGLYSRQEIEAKHEVVHELRSDSDLSLSQAPAKISRPAKASYSQEHIDGYGHECPKLPSLKSITIASRGTSIGTGTGTGAYPDRQGQGQAQDHSQGQSQSQSHYEHHFDLSDFRFEFD